MAVDRLLGLWHRAGNTPVDAADNIIAERIRIGPDSHQSRSRSLHFAHGLLLMAYLTFELCTYVRSSSSPMPLGM